MVSVNKLPGYDWMNCDRIVLDGPFVDCPQCGTLVAASDRPGGVLLVCPACGDPFDDPRLADGTDAGIDDVEHEDYPGQRVTGPELGGCARCGEGFETIADRVVLESGTTICKGCAQPCGGCGLRDGLCVC